MTTAELWEKIARGDPAVARRQGILIVDAGESLVGIITRGDLLRVLQSDPAGSRTVLAAGKTDRVVAHPDELPQDAIARMLRHNAGRLPVTDPRYPARVTGYLGRPDILAARARYHEEEGPRECGPATQPLKTAG